MLAEAKKDQVRLLAALEKASFEIFWDEKTLQREMESNPFSRTYFFIEDGQVIGYVIVWEIFEEATISRFAILPRYRRKGYARKFMEELIEMLQDHGLERIALEVRVSNERAIDLYTKNGFVILNRAKNYYGNEDGFRMMRGI